MKAIEKRRLEFLEDTLKYYSEDTNRRALDDQGGSCRYKTEDGKKCAIGRFIPDEKYKKSIEGCSVREVMHKNLLSEEILSLGSDFLNSIQGLHDHHDYWIKNGISKKGEKYIEFIKKNYCDV